VRSSARPRGGEDLQQQGKLHALDGGTRAEIAVEDLRRAVHDGDLLPGQALSLRSLAEERRVRPHTLMMLLERLQRERILEIRGDVAIVAPLDADALTSAFRLGDLVAPTVVSRAFELVTEAQLSEFEALLPAHGVSVPDAALDQDFRALARMPSQLMTVGSPWADRYVIESILEFNWRYLVLSQRSLASPAESPWITLLEGYGDVFDLLRQGSAADAAGLVHSLNRHHQDFVRICLDEYRGSDDDYPIGEVIPINRSRLRRG
jgi:DNA-binding GntR family transcriptional regulator